MFESFMVTDFSSDAILFFSSGSEFYRRPLFTARAIRPGTRLVGSIDNVRVPTRHNLPFKRRITIAANRVP
jgi:hypothetical protein